MAESGGGSFLSGEVPPEHLYDNPDGKRAIAPSIERIRENIPWLAEQDSWLVWEWSDEAQKWPHRGADPSKKTEWETPGNQASLEEAWEAYQSHGHLDGVGFVFNGTEPEILEDFDNSVNPWSNTVSDPCLEDALENDDEPAFFSSSGTGAHRYPVAANAEPTKQHPHEVYIGDGGNNRWAAITGFKIAGDEHGPDRSDRVNELSEKYNEAEAKAVDLRNFDFDADPTEIDTDAPVPEAITEAFDGDVPTCVAGLVYVLGTHDPTDPDGPGWGQQTFMRYSHLLILLADHLDADAETLAELVASFKSPAIAATQRGEHFKKSAKPKPYGEGVPWDLDYQAAKIAGKVPTGDLYPPKIETIENHCNVKIGGCNCPVHAGRRPKGEGDNRAEVATDGSGAAAVQGGSSRPEHGGQSRADDIGPGDIYEVLDIPREVPLRKINNNQVANGIETLLSTAGDVHLRVLDNIDSKDQEIYSMDPDTMVWEPKGVQRLGQISRSILGMHNSQGIQNELANALRTNPEGYWLLDRDELGPDDDLFPVENGLLNLTTRTPREPAPDDFLLGRTPTAYDANASIEGTRFEQFLMQAVSPADLDKLQEYAGYCLLHSRQPYKKALFLFGPTNSGKGTFIEVLTAILGQENVSSESLYSLLCTRWGYHSIYGAWLNVSNELTPGGLKNVEKFKTLTGGEDRVTAEDKGVSKYEFTVTQKFIFATNQFPEVEDADKAFFKRCLFVEFPNTVPDEKLDPDLVDTLKSERSAILNWMLDGLDRLRENRGKFTNERDYDAKREITRAFGSPIDQFAYRALNVTNDADHVVDKKGLYSAFTRFCDYIEKDTPTQRAFTRRLKEQSGITDGKSRRVDPDGNRRDVYKGIQLEPDLFKTIQADLPGHSYEDDGDDGGQQRF